MCSRRYLNAAVVGRDRAGARDLLSCCSISSTNAAATRPRRARARTLDLDLILYGDDVISEPDLERAASAISRARFVLGPLAELAPDCGIRVRDGPWRSYRADCRNVGSVGSSNTRRFDVSEPSTCVRNL